MWKVRTIVKKYQTKMHLCKNSCSHLLESTSEYEASHEFCLIFGRTHTHKPTVSLPRTNHPIRLKTTPPPRSSRGVLRMSRASMRSGDLVKENCVHRAKISCTTFCGRASLRRSNVNLRVSKKLLVTPRCVTTALLLFDGRFRGNALWDLLLPQLSSSSCHMWIWIQILCSLSKGQD